MRPGDPGGAGLPPPSLIVSRTERPPTYTYIRARFPWRAAIYGVVILYLFADLYWLGGPLSVFINTFATRKASAEGWVAQVYGVPITRREFDEALDAHLLRRGDSLDDYQGEAKFAVQIRVLEDLVEQRVIATWSDGEAVPGFDGAAVDVAVDTILRSFPGDGAFSAELASRSLDRTTLRHLLEKPVRVAAWIEAKIAPAIVVTDDEIAEFYTSERAGGRLVVPATMHARHVFLSAFGDAGEALDRGDEIEALHREIEGGGAALEEVARTYSEDPRSRGRGGDLGHFTRESLPADFAESVWALAPGGRSRPFRTAMGWHIVEVVDRAPGRALTLAEAAPEIRAFLESRKRTAAVGSLKAQIRQRAKGNVAYYYHVLIDADSRAGQAEWAGAPAGTPLR